MKPTILIVEDEPSGRKVIESILENQGYELDFAANGREALKKAGILKPDLILLDIMLPEMDGMEVCERLRKDNDLAEVPVVMITALDDRNTRIACIDAGADDFITKPIDRAELRARVRSITRLNRYRLLHERDLITSWVAEKASDGYLQLNADDRIVYANSRARFYLGLDADAAKPILETFMQVALHQYAPHPQSLWDGWPVISAKNLAPDRFLVRPESNLAHEFWLEATIFEIPGKDGAPRTRIIRLRDVTADILNRRNTRSFGEAISHKIRTPITHIISSLELLTRLAAQMSPEDIARFSATALRGATRLYETLNRVLQYSNLHSSVDAEVGFSLSEFEDLVKKVSNEMGLEHVALSMPEDLISVQIIISVQSVEVLLWEILSNSSKFHPAGKPAVTIEVLRASPQRIGIRISDDGLSLSPKQLSTVWLPYYQGEKDFTGEAPGMGLGLSTVSAIVWGAGGACRLTNRDNGPGVVVELMIPEVEVGDPAMAFTGELNGRI
ncbi:MAG: response regulator [Chloroflexota bacterium]